MTAPADVLSENLQRVLNQGDGAFALIADNTLDCRSLTREVDPQFD